MIFIVIFFFYLALSAAISKSVNDIIIEESSKTFFFFSLICTDGLPCYRRIGVSVWSACLLLLGKRDPLDVVVFFFSFVCAVKDIYYRWQQPTPPKKRYTYTYLLSLVAQHLFDLNHFMAIASTDMPHWQMCFNLGKYENGSFWFVVTYILLYIIWYMNLAKHVS